MKQDKTDQLPLQCFPTNIEGKPRSQHLIEHLERIK